MCSSTGSRTYHEPFCHHGNSLVRYSGKRPKYAVQVEDGTRCQAKCCIKVTVLEIDTMEPLPRRAYVKAGRFPVGSAVCFGEYQRDCPFIFVSGGDGPNKKTINVYDVLLDKWSKLGDLNTPRSHHKMHCWGQQLYVIGGICDGLIETYELVKGNETNGKLTKGQRTTVRGCLKEKVHDFPSAVFDGRIYVFGGISDRGPVRCVQYFNTTGNVLAQLPHDLPCECQGGVAVVLGNQIYIATEHGRLIRFDPATGISSLCANQPFNRTNFALVERMNTLHLFGGLACLTQRSESPKDLVYDPVEDSWSEAETCCPSMVVSSACVVEYSKARLSTPFHQDLFSHVPRTCKHAKL